MRGRERERKEEREKRREREREERHGPAHRDNATSKNSYLHAAEYTEKIRPRLPFPNMPPRIAQNPKIP